MTTNEWQALPGSPESHAGAEAPCTALAAHTPWRAIAWEERYPPDKPADGDKPPRSYWFINVGTTSELSGFIDEADARTLAAAQDMLAALIKLSNEVLGSLPLMEPLARREFGNTNYNILIQTAQEARSVISRATGAAS